MGLRKEEYENPNFPNTRNKITAVVSRRFKIDDTACLFKEARRESSSWKPSCGYFVKDLDGKGQPELCISYGNGGLDTFLYVYRYSKGRARFVDKAYCDGCTWYDIPNKKGVIWNFGRQGCSFTSVYTLKKNKIVIKKCVGYAGFPFQFDSHITYKEVSANRTIGVLSYSGIG